MQDNSVPLSFDSFQFLKIFSYNISEAKNDKPIENHVVSLEPMYNKLQHSSRVLHDPIVDVLDDIYSQTPSPIANYELKNIDDKNLIRQSASLSCSTGVSLQISFENV